MRFRETLEKSIDDNLNGRPYHPSAIVARLVYVVTVLIFIAGIYVGLVYFQWIEALLICVTAILFCSRWLMGYRYWTLVNWHRDLRKKVSLTEHKNTPDEA